ncbi:MAG: cation:dicarboxylase symporter family transporter [Mogibacterium sp.]|nr:cation:dicarboxylase symporter family transporter [Mogibacterium sp.]
MKIRNTTSTYTLAGPEIDRFAGTVDELLTEMGTERQNRLRIRLSLEEAMLRLRDRFGEKDKVTLYTGSFLGRSSIRLEHEGDIYNPLSKKDLELEDWSASLLTGVGLSPQYSRAGNRNVLKLSLPVRGLNPFLKAFIAIALGALLGTVGVIVLPGIFSAVSRDVLYTPTYFLLNRLLTVISGPIIFLMVLTTMLNAARLNEQGASGWKIVVRYLLLSVFAAAAALAVALLVFRLDMTGDNISSESAQGFLEMIFSIVPENLIDPIIEVNTAQLILIAVIIGNAMIVLGDRVSAVARFVKQTNTVGLIIADWVSRLMPVFVVVLVAAKIEMRQTVTLVGIWKPFLITLILAAIYCMVVVFIIAGYKKVSPGMLARKVLPPFLTSVRKGSLDESFGQAEQSCVEKLGIDRHFTMLSLPHGLILYMPISTIGTVIFTMYISKTYEITLSPLWCFTAVVLAVTLSAAAPPVPGAGMLTYMAIFASLNIPGDALIEAMLFDLLIGVFAAAANQAVLQLELVLQAGRMGVLNLQKLQKE